MHNTYRWTSGHLVAPLLRGPGAAESLPSEIIDIDVERGPDRPTVAHIVGAIDLLTAPALRRCVDDNLTADTGLVLDLSGVDFLAASGLTVLTDTDARAARDNVAWGLVANTRPVLRPLEVLGLRDTLPTYDSVPHAVAAVGATV